MRTIHNYTIRHESWEEAWKDRMHNRRLVLTFRDRKGIHSHTIGNGDGDDLYVMREGEETYLLGLRPSLGYVALDIFKSGDHEGGVFLSIDYEIDEILGRNGFDLSPITIAKRLREYVQ